jgi:hypothetical protein
VNAVSLDTSCARILVAARSVQWPPHSAEYKPLRGTQNLMLLSNNLDVDMRVVRDHLIRRVLGGGESNVGILTMWKWHSSGRLSRSNDGVDRVLQDFIRGPEKSFPGASEVFQMPQTTLRRILRNRVRLIPWKIQDQKLSALDRQFRRQSTTEKCSEILNRYDVLSRIVFTVEAKFHISGRASQHNCDVWKSELPRGHLE